MNFKQLCEKTKEFSVVTGTAENIISLEWKPVKHADGYRVFVSPHNKNYFKGELNTTETSVKLKGCENGVPLDFKVKAFRTADGPESFFGQSHIVTACPMKTPENLKAAADNSGNISISWKSCGDCDGYKIYTAYNDSENFTFRQYCPENRCIISSVDRDGSVKIKVRSFKVIGKEEKLSNYSEEVSVVVTASNVRVAPELRYERPTGTVRDTYENHYSVRNNALESKRNRCEIIIGGDISTCPSVQREAYNNGLSFDFTMSGIKDLLNTSDFAIASLDTDLNDTHAYTLENPSELNCPSTLADALYLGGFDAVALNRSVVRSAPVSLKKYPISVVSGDKCELNSQKFNSTVINNIRVTYLSVTLDEAAQTVVSQAAENSDFTIVFCDWKEKHIPVVKKKWRTYAKRLADWGADYVVGTGLNSLCEVESVSCDDGRSVPVAYSLGCLVSNTPATAFESIGALLCLRLEKRNGERKAYLEFSGYFPYSMRARGGVNVATPLIKQFRENFTVQEYHRLSKVIAERIGEEIKPARREKEKDSVSFALHGSSLISGLFRGYDGVYTDRSHLFVSQLSMCGEFSNVEERYYADNPAVLYANLTKDFEKHSAENPSDYLILDLYYTAVTPVYEMDNVLYSGGKSFVQSTFYKENKKFLKALDFSDKKVWKGLLDKYIQSILSVYHNKKIILVKVHDPELYEIDGKIINGRDNTLDMSMLTEMQNYFIKKVNPLVIDLSRFYCGKVNRYGALYAINRDPGFSDNISKSVYDFVCGGLKYSGVNADSVSWLRQIRDNYDAIKHSASEGFFFGGTGAAEHLISRLSGDFVSSNFNDLVRLRDSGYKTYADLLKRFDFAGNRTLENVCNAVNALRKGQFDYDCVEDVIRLGLYAKKDLADVLTSYFDNEGIIPGCRITDFDVDFYFKCARLYRNGGNKSAVKLLLGEYYKKNRPVTMDVWGSESLCRIIESCERVTVGVRLTDSSALTAFSDKTNIDLSYIDRKSPYFNEISRRFPEQIENASDWILIDFRLAIRSVFSHNGTFITRISGFESTRAFKNLCKDDVKFYPYDENSLFTNEYIENAVSVFADFLRKKYGEKIILARTYLSENYLDLQGRLRPVADARLEAKNTFIAKLEEMFIQLTDCYVLDYSDKFIWKQISSGKDFALAKEDMFFSSCAKAIEKIAYSDSECKNYSSVDIVDYIERTERIKASNTSLSPSQMYTVCKDMTELML